VKLINLKLINFRNIEQADIHFSKNINILYGGNGQGKTSILEAIYFLGITKSFRIGDEKAVVKTGQDYFDVSGNFKKKTDQIFTIRVFFSGTDGKHVFYNKEKIKTFSSIIGTVPIVLLSLEDLDLTYGSPSARRKFIDILISQIDPNYLQSLKQFKKVVLNRNKVLSLISDGKADLASLRPWDQQFIQYGSYLLQKRKIIIEELSSYINKYYQGISGTSDVVEIRYQTSVPYENETDIQEIRSRIQQKLEETRQRDLAYGSTSTGPHRDDLLFFKNKQPLKIFGSQGENKTFLIGLKFAEAFLIEEHLKENPLLLLDDIFSELDRFRIEKVLQNIQAEQRQTFITTTEADKFGKDRENIDFFHVLNGKISNET
jgi:DNA replication and repair protein RecF